MSGSDPSSPPSKPARRKNSGSPMPEAEATPATPSSQSRPPGRDLNLDPEFTDPLDLESGRLLQADHEYQPRPRRTERDASPPPEERRYSRAFLDGQQQAGQKSLNPRGRPPGTPNPGAFLRRMCRPMPMRTRDGSVVNMQTIEAVKQTVANGAARGNRFIVALAEKETVRDAAWAARLAEEQDREALKTDKERHLDACRRKFENDTAAWDLLHEAFFPPKHRELLELLRKLAELGILSPTKFGFVLAPGMAELFPLIVEE